MLRSVLLSSICALGALACSGAPASESGAGAYGASPELAAPKPQTIPKVNIADAKGWPDGGAPTPARGMAVQAFARGLQHPRWIVVAPNGDVLVAETDTPKKPPEGLRGIIMDAFMKRAGSSAGSADRITLLRDADGDGAAETRTVLVSGLHSPFGMAIGDGVLYVANTDALLRFPYKPGDTQITDKGAVVAALPGGELNHHWTKNVVLAPDGSRLYVSIGSNSNVGENGMEAEKGRAAIWSVDPKTGATASFATGLRNPVGMAFEPTTGVLWTAVNERDELGDDLVPDYITSVREGAFYGWPYSYYGAHVDPRVKPQNPELVARAIAPDYALGAHTASLGLAFADAKTPAPFQSGVFVGQHGSWNRSAFAGYKVIFVPFAEGRPSGPPQDVLTGFLSPKGDAWGRPVGVTQDGKGGLLVADDVGNTIWRVSAAKLADAALAPRPPSR